jgi:hypothetical protein
MTRNRYLAVLAIAVASLLSACSFSASTTKTVDASQVEAKGVEALAKTTGDSTITIHCDDDLPVKEGSKITCDLTSANGPFDVVATAGKTTGSNVHIDFLVVEDAG